jgi:hypothetical protein
LAVGGICAWEILVLTLARNEDLVLGGVGGIVGATNTIVDVFAEVSGVGLGGVTKLEAEGVGAKEVVPFDSLIIFALVTAPSI